MRRPLPRTLALSAAAVTAALLAPGCVMPDQVSKMQKDIADVRAELNRMSREQAAALADLEEARRVADETDESVTRADLADLDARLDRIERQVEASEQGVRDLGDRMDRMSQDLARARMSERSRVTSTQLPEERALEGSGDDEAGDATGRPSGGARPDPEELYNTAYADFSKGNYALAVSGFQEYYDTFSDSTLADNALYWVGECYFSQGDFPSAVRAFDRMLETFPDSDKAPAANLKKALAYQDQNQVRLAIEQLRYVVGTYPDSDEAKIARDRLAGLGQPI